LKYVSQCVYFSSDYNISYYQNMCLIIFSELGLQMTNLLPENNGTTNYVESADHSTVPPPPPHQIQGDDIPPMTWSPAPTPDQQNEATSSSSGGESSSTRRVANVCIAVIPNGGEFLTIAKRLQLVPPSAAREEVVQSELEEGGDEGSVHTIGDSGDLD
jgi:hypothetical protein